MACADTPIFYALFPDGIVLRGPLYTGSTTPWLNESRFPPEDKPQ
jgi:hypothetical protein